MRRRFVLAAACLAVPGLLAAGCGNDRQDAPQVGAVAKPAGQRIERIRSAGVTFARPRNWSYTGARLPQLATVGSGRAVMTLWRYRRVEKLPRTNAEILRARKALVVQARKRDRSIRILFARGTRLNGTPAVVLVADEKIGLVRRKVRSTHIYANGAELVVDAYAPPGDFAAADREAFQPLVHSVRLNRPPARRRS